MSPDLAMCKHPFFPIKLITALNTAALTNIPHQDQTGNLSKLSHKCDQTKPLNGVECVLLSEKRSNPNKKRQKGK